MTVRLAIPVEGMHCAGCVGRVERALGAIPGARDVSVNLATETAFLDVPGVADTGEVISVLSRSGYPARTEAVDLVVDGMHCASCVRRIEAAMADVPGVVSAAANLATGQVRVTRLSGHAPGSALIAALAAVGYKATVPSATDTPDIAARRAEEARDVGRQAMIAAVLTLPVFLTEMGGHLIPALHQAIGATIGMGNAWVLQFVLISLVLILPGAGFFRHGIPALLRGAPDMNSLVALGTAAAWGYSTVATFAPQLLPATARAVYFESAGVIVTLILLGRWFEARAKGQTGAAISSLLALTPQEALRITGADTQVTPIDQLAPGDLIRIRPGERIAADGILREGFGHVDESMITGEPIPVGKQPGDAVTGGTVNGTSALTIEVARTGKDSTLAQIVRLVEGAQAAKLPVQSLVDQITRWFVPVVLGLATLTALVWLVVGPNLGFALVAAVSVLIIACPCAMGLAVPTSIMVATGRGAAKGVLFARGDALQQLAEVRTIAFDKTGTITEGRPVLTDVLIADCHDRSRVLTCVAAVERQSEHPLARALAEAEDGSLPEVRDFAAIPGLGVSAKVNGSAVLIGSAALMARDGIEMDDLVQGAPALESQGRTVFYASINGVAVARLGVSDPIKDSSLTALAALRARGGRLAMITGDSAQTAQAVADRAGIDEVVAGVLPDGKVAALKALQAHGPVAFVGDGINDAPALAAADVGLAIGTGTDVAVEAADVVLMSGDLTGVATARELSQRTMGNIRQNLGWAFGYNVLLIPVAAGVLYPGFGLMLSPMIAAGAMALSSVFVLGNALRLRRA